MGWSRLNKVRAQEAATRRVAMHRIGYGGRLDDDGNPLDGPGTPMRGYDATGRHPRRLSDAVRLRSLELDALDAATCGGGHNGQDDPRVIWPYGYRWTNNGQQG